LIAYRKQRFRPREVAPTGRDVQRLAHKPTAIVVFRRE
jgi:hypothetical protein